MNTFVPHLWSWFKVPPIYDHPASAAYKMCFAYPKSTHSPSNGNLLDPASVHPGDMFWYDKGTLTLPFPFKSYI